VLKITADYFSNVLLDGSRLWRINLMQTKLTYAQLSHANLKHADLSCANLEGV
jgi:uncharacterized protein YjbI with pentapeptide repeats